MYTITMNIKQNMTLARFWSKVNIPTTNGKSNACWTWNGPITAGGYGTAIDANNKWILAHRFIAGLSNDITDKVVMHICDNPACVRPDHLAVGTHHDNTHDMIDKGRHPTIKSRNFTAAEIRDIRKCELSQKEYAEKYNETVGYIGRIQRRESYKHII